VTCAHRQRVEKANICGRRCECVSGLNSGGRSASMLTPVGPVPSPAVLNTSSRRTLSDAFASRWPINACTPRKGRIAFTAGHAYAGTRKSSLAFSFVFNHISVPQKGGT
jgi:hypothetical protein